MKNGTPTEGYKLIQNETALKYACRVFKNLEITQNIDEDLTAYQEYC